MRLFPGFKSTWNLFLINHRFISRYARNSIKHFSSILCSSGDTSTCLNHVFLFLTDIQQHWRELWAGDFDLNPSLHLPAENKFIGGCLQLTSFNVVAMYCICSLFQDRLQLFLCLFSPPATDFALKTSDCPDTEYPVRIMNNDRGCLWYKKDNKFKIPKGVVVFVSTLNISCLWCPIAK